MRSLRCALAAFVVSLLSACNIAMSGEPFFSERAHRTINLKSGLWIPEDRECPFDPALALNQWPGCAEGILVEGNQLRDPHVKSEDIYEYVLVDRSPAILQVTKIRGKEPRSIYYYFAATPRRSADGQIVAVDAGPFSAVARSRGGPSRGRSGHSKASRRTA